MSNLLQRIVTSNFITFNAHCWFAYAVVYTFPHPTTAYILLATAAIKEFYLDKHFEVAQSFVDNLSDWSEYLAGTLLALLALSWL